MTLSRPTLNGVALTTDMVTGRLTSFKFGVNHFNATAGSHPNDYKTRLVVRISTDPGFSSYNSFPSAWKNPGFSCGSSGGSDLSTCVSVTIGDLPANTKYYVRMYMDYNAGSSGEYDLKTGSFFTDRPPSPPAIATPVDGQAFTGASPVNFSWAFADPDVILNTPHSIQKGYQLRYRTAQTPLSSAGPWTTSSATTATQSLSVAAINFASNTQFEWQVRTQDYRDLWGDWSDSSFFYMGGTTAAPVLLEPSNDIAIRVDEDNEFSWLFRDPDQSTAQTNADLRYREVNTGLWTTLVGGPGPGGNYILDSPDTNATFETNELWESLTAFGFFPTPATTARSLVRAATGVASLLATWGTEPTQSWVNIPVLGLTIGATYTVAADVWVPSGDPDVMMEVAFVSTGAATAVKDTWVRIWTTFVAYDTTAFVGVRANNTTAGDQVWIDNAMVNLGTVAETFTTDTPGTVLTPGVNQFWDLPAGTFTEDTHYEWQARTYNSVPVASDWSGSSYFWAAAVGQSATDVTPELTEEQFMLGVGDNKAYIYDRGGTRRRGEITPIAKITWTRKRDDISNCHIVTNGFGDDNGALLSEIRSWRHEIVVFRDGVRVWEGPVVRPSFHSDHVEVEAKDVMAYVYRRILRQGYNDAYRVVNGIQQGLRSVVFRARQIIMNALSYDDPNVLRYLTALEYADDAKQSRSVPPFSKTAFGDVDDLAATAGLDYTVVGRRIILNDTHRQVGRLPEMTDNDFSEPPVVTEYGMSAANVYAVTNNAGVYGLVARVPTPFGTAHLINPPPEGFLEMLSSAYGESEGAATTTTLTAAAKAALEATLRSQAERSIAGRWPVPVVVRVPDNVTLNPELNIGINQLVPGTWIPLKAVGALRKVSQTQKLDSVTVTQESGKAETITVVMSPAPRPGTDPDADESEVEE